MDASSKTLSFPARFRMYLAERFPVGPYVLLIGALIAATVAAAALASGERGAVRFGLADLGAFAVAFLAFFHLRVFDEHKDAEQDLVAHPHRVLSRGLITLRQLAVAGVIAVVIQAALAAALGTAALAFWGAAFGYTVLMRVEFFAPRFLRRHTILYLVSHNPVVVLLTLFAAAAHDAAAPCTAPVLLFGAIATTTSLGFEVGRKVRAPADEREGQETYTAALGVPGAALLHGAIWIGVAASCVAYTLVAEASWVAGGAMVGTSLAAVSQSVRFVRNPSASVAKVIDGVSSGAALIIYLAVAIEAMVRLGVTWSA